jgi:hypothetical protein
MRYNRAFLVPYLQNVAAAELLKKWCSDQSAIESRKINDSQNLVNHYQFQLDNEIPPAKLPPYKSELKWGVLVKPWLLLLAIPGSILAFRLLLGTIHWFFSLLLILAPLGLFPVCCDAFDCAKSEKYKEQWRYDLYQRELSTYYASLRAYESRKGQRDSLRKKIAQEQKKQQILLKRKDFFNQQIKKISKILTVLYSPNVIPAPYRNVYAAYYLHDYISTSQENDVDSVIKTFVLEKISAKLDTIITQQTQIIMNQRRIINEQIKAKEQSLENHRELMKKFAYAEKSAAQRDQYLKMIHSDLELSNYLQANQSWIVEIK